MPNSSNSGASGEWAQRAEAVREAGTENFSELLRLSGLDPQKHLRFVDWSGLSFASCDLRGFDFTGARLNDCDFTGAFIKDARFDQAEIKGANLRAAKDWQAHAKSWRRPERETNAERSLPFLSVFQDAPFAPEMVVVPPGSFMMGAPPDEPGRSKDEGPQHEVTIAHRLAVGRYAVTFDEWDFAQADKDWRRITGLKPRKPKDEGWGRGDRPVIDVSQEDAQGYAKWLCEKTGKGYRLPSEAEWEYVCRAGTATPFWWGASITPEQANYDGNYTYEGGGAKGEYREKTVPVNSFQPNAWGLYQVHGNVWEWCEDVWHNSYEGASTDDAAWITGDGSRRVLRGGSWVNSPRDLRAALRLRITTDLRYYVFGFRVSRTLNP